MNETPKKDSVLDEEVLQDEDKKPKEDKGSKVKMVPVPEDKLAQILDTLEEQKKQIAVLTEAGDKEKIRKFTELRGSGKLVKNVNVSVITGKIVIGWRKVKDDVYLDEQNRIHEDQIVEVMFLDKSKKEFDYRTFSRLATKMKGEVLEESKDRDGNTNLLIQLADGQEVKLDIKFIN